MTNFEEALKITLSFEGGYSNHPADPGGETNRGITREVWHRYFSKDIKDQTPEDASLIYLKEYWEPLRCDEMALPLGGCLFDTGVNLGIGQAVLLLQRATWTREDGVLGRETVSAAIKASPLPASYCLLTLRRQFYIALARRQERLGVFKEGWLNRVKDLWRWCNESGEKQGEQPGQLQKGSPQGQSKGPA